MIKTLVLVGLKITNSSMQKTLPSLLPYAARFFPHNLVRCSRRLHLSVGHLKSEDSKPEKNEKSVQTTTKKRRKNAHNLIHDVSKELSSEPDKRKKRAEEIKEQLHKINDKIDFRKRNKRTTEQSDIQKPHFGHLSTEQLMDYFRRKPNAQANTKPLNQEKISFYENMLHNRQNKRLNIFDMEDLHQASESRTQDEKNEGREMNAKDWWEHFEKMEKMKAKAYIPKNHYQEMIEWAEQGRFPNLPIENEIGMEEEEGVSFHNHIFLHELIDEGFPKRGPVRKFMEAVALGLSMNPYLTVQEKEDHINWFRDYFKEKLDLLTTLGTVEDPKMIDSVPHENETAS